MEGSRMSRVVAFSVAVVAAAKEPVGLNASPAATATPNSTSTPKTKAATGAVQDLSDPSLGIVFDAVPAVHGDAADVYNWIATFEKESWRTMTTNAVSPAFSVMASADVQATMTRVATNNTKDQVKIGGVFHATVANISVDGDTARGTVCDDYREATFSDAGGPDTPQAAGFGQPSLGEVTLARGALAGSWTIQKETRTGTC
jgi:hypothetical protein